jgi:hypothetical protein
MENQKNEMPAKKGFLETLLADPECAIISLGMVASLPMLGMALLNCYSLECEARYDTAIQERPAIVQPYEQTPVSTNAVERYEQR